jgi:hypothetical protein
MGALPCAGKASRCRARHVASKCPWRKGAQRRRSYSRRCAVSLAPARRHGLDHTSLAWIHPVLSQKSVGLAPARERLRCRAGAPRAQGTRVLRACHHSKAALQHPLCAMGTSGPWHCLLLLLVRPVSGKAHALARTGAQVCLLLAGKHLDGGGRAAPRCAVLLGAMQLTGGADAARKRAAGGKVATCCARAL